MRKQGIVPVDVSEEGTGEDCLFEDTNLLIRVVAAALAFAAGIWIGCGYPGLIDKYAKSERAPRKSPWRWWSIFPRKPRSDSDKAVQVEKEEDAAETRRGRPAANFRGGWRMRR